MVNATAGKHQAGLEAVCFQVGHRVKDLGGVETEGEKVEKSLTRIRIPRTQGRPPHCFGLTVRRGERTCRIASGKIGVSTAI